MNSDADTNTESLLGHAARDFQSRWKSLFLTDLAFKLVAFIVLTPLVGFLFRGLLAVSGSAVLADMDILFFFLGPLGWVCLILIGAVWLGIVALEQASLTAVIGAHDAQERLRPLGALRFAATKALPVLQLTGRIVLLTGLVVAPFGAVAAAVYFLLLNEYDINYYLQERPPAFTTAVCIGGVLCAALAALLLRLASSWLLALPLVLFEDVKPAAALRESAQRTQGHRLKLVKWIVTWFAVTTVISIAATAMVGLLGRMIIPDSTASLSLLATTVGLVLVCLTVVGLAVNLLSTTTFAVILFRLYRHCGGKNSSEILDYLAENTPAGPAIAITRKRLLIAGVIGVAIAIAVGASALRSVRLEDDVQIMAHRGSSMAAPENTMAAIRQAIEDGADWVEIDVQETADGEVVVFHDSDFMKTAGRNLKIWDATMGDLRDIDIGSWYDPQYQDERVPTLAEVLDECRGKIGVNIELKYYGHDDQLEQRVVDIVESRDMVDQVMAMSLKMVAVKKMKSLRPHWKVGLLMSVSAGNIKNIEADFLAVNASFANPNLIRTAHNNNKEVYVWTVNDAPTMSTMISRGVDGLLTDKPALARTVLQQRSQMSAPERLLLEIASTLGATPELGEP